MKEATRLLDAISNWYVRRNRRRFWKSTNREDQHSAYITLYECLNTAHKLMAPFTPFLSENVYQNLTRSLDSEAPLSIHMTECLRSILCTTTMNCFLKLQ